MSSVASQMTETTLDTAELNRLSPDVSEWTQQMDLLITFLEQLGLNVRACQNLRTQMQRVRLQGYCVYLVYLGRSNQMPQKHPDRPAVQWSSAGNSWVGLQNGGSAVTFFIYDRSPEAMLLQEVAEAISTNNSQQLRTVLLPRIQQLLRQ